MHLPMWQNKSNRTRKPKENNLWFEGWGKVIRYDKIGKKRLGEQANLLMGGVKKGD
jgi:hypothetical protein